VKWWTARLAAIGSVIAVGLFTGAGLASAHDQLNNQSPGRDEHLAASPAEVSLSFSGRPLPIGMTVLVVDASGKDWAAGVPRAEGSVVRRPVTTLPAGYYQVRWRVVSADGAVVSGNYDFAVGDTAGSVKVPVTARGAKDAGLAGSGAYRGRTGAPDGVGDGPSVPRLVASAVVGAVFSLGLGWVAERVRRRRSAVGIDEREKK
jgi:methionine-rich copper-binding protein CopC